MTELEKSVLSILSADARLTPEAIASMLQEEPEKISSLIRSLEERGYIVKYMTIVHTDEQDERRVEALIEVKVAPKKGEGFDGIARRIAEYSEVKGVYLAVFVEGASLRKVARFVSECISTFEGVLSTATHFILKKYKIEGVLTERLHDKRLSVHA